MWLAIGFMVMPAIGQYRLTGKVVDDGGASLPGANLAIVELNRGTVATMDGSFVIEQVPSGDFTLKISYVGYMPREIPLKIQGNLEVGVISLETRAVMGEEVIVTATRAGENAPVAFSEIQQEEIQARNFGQDVPFLLQSTPSLVTSSDAGHGIGYTSLRIRGTDANRINVTINGVPLNDAESHSVYWVDLPDIAASTDNIQIQRGVGTSTNGASAFGASINLQTKKLEPEPYALYEGGAGSYGTYRNAISAGTGLIGDHFSIDLRLSDLHSEGYIDRARTDLRSYYLSAGYHDEKTLVRFITFTGFEELYQAWGGVPSSLLKTNRTYNGLGASTDASGELAYYDNQIDHYLQEHYQLHLSRAFTNRWSAHAAIHYTRGAGYYEEYVESASLAAYQLQDVVVGGDTIRESDLIRRKWLDNHFYGAIGGVHFRDDRVTAILGGGWNRYDGDHYGTVVWARYAGGSEIRHRWYENTGLKTDWNGYVKTTLEAGGGFSLFADLQLRGIDYSIRGIDDDLRDITQDHPYLFFNPKAGINLQLDRNQRAYLFVARANREPNRSNFVDADPAGPVPVKETLVDLEAGYVMEGNQMHVHANLYYMDYTDQLVLTGEINDVGSPVMTNVKDSYRTGLELMAGVRFFSWMRWDVNATISRNKILDYTGYVDNWDYWTDPEGEPYQVEEELGTTNLAFSPQLIANSNLDISPVEDLHLLLVSRYAGQQYVDNTSSDDRTLAPYLVTDLRISYGFYPKWMKEVSLHLQVANLFNVSYETNAWIYRYYLEGEEAFMDGYYPQAGTHFMAGIRLQF